MNPHCREIEELLPDWERGSLPPAEAARVEAHLAECAHCIRQLADHDALLALTRSAFEAAEADVRTPDLTRAVMDRIAPAKKARPVFRWHASWRLALAPAAIVLIAFLGITLIEPTPPSEASVQEEFDRGLELYDSAFAKAGPNRQEFLKKAIDTFRELRRRYPEEKELGAVAAVFEADSYRELGEPSRAAESYRRVLSDYDHEGATASAVTEARVALVELLLENGFEYSATEQHALAATDLEQLMALEEPPPQVGKLCLKFADWQYANDPLKAESWYEACLRHSPPISREANRARQTLDALQRQLERSQIKDWLVLGPFKCERITDELPPEEKIDLFAEYAGEGGAKLKWRRVHKPDGYHAIDLHEVFDQEFLGTAYVYTRVHSAERRAVRIHIGSDDSARVWLNGKVVYSNNNGITMEHNAPVDATLKQGWNEILIKVQDLMHHGWSMEFRIAGTDGQVIRNLIFDPNGGG